MNWKRPLAIIGVIFLLSMYAVAIFAAFSNHPQSKNWLMAAVFSTVLVPVFIYAMELVYRVLKPDSAGIDKQKEHEEK
ncbi:hypothetical protein [Clostridium sp. HBUAS56010]|uniref:hypothetical protein n=1 Tax=Clostridium sp. HBUAS56010 TaxID=2571127 RepID=UPI0011786D9A|nr:hypothetical protein [Clostridium sp. HBUAS56010]